MTERTWKTLLDVALWLLVLGLIALSYWAFRPLGVVSHGL